MSPFFLRSCLILHRYRPSDKYHDNKHDKKGRGIRHSFGRLWMRNRNSVDVTTEREQQNASDKFKKPGSDTSCNRTNCGVSGHNRSMRNLRVGWWRMCLYWLILYLYGWYWDACNVLRLILILAFKQRLEFGRFRPVHNRVGSAQE